MFSLKKFIFSLILIFGAASALMAQPSISAKVDKTVAEVGSRIVLSISISGADGDADLPTLPALANFNSFYNNYEIATTLSTSGRFKAVITHKYILIPRFAGRAEIPPITIKHRGQEYSTQPIIIDVYRQGESQGKNSPAQPSQPKLPPAAAASAQQPAKTNTAASSSSKPQTSRNLTDLASNPPLPSGGYKDVFFTAFTDKQTAYAGEQITMVLGFYNSVPTSGEITYEPPTFEGLLKEEMGSSDGTAYVNNKSYEYFAAKTALFGVTPGKALINKTKVLFGLRTKNIWGFSSTQPVITESQPVEITILPLPEENKGEYFYGGVGNNFSIDVNLDRTTIEVGEAANLTITIKGIGNIKSVTAPKIPQIKGFKTYDVAGTSNVTAIKDVVQGIKTFKTVLVPSVSGEHTIPSIPFTYFNPAAKKYVTLKTQPVVLTVTAMSSAGSAGEAISFGGQEGIGGSVKILSNEINYIKEGVGKNKFDFLSFVSSLGWLNLLPFIFVVMLFLSSTAHKKGFFERPYAKAKKALHKAKTIDEVNSAFSSYIKEKTGFSTGAMTTKNLVCALENKYKITSKLAQQIISVQDGLNLYKYAPVGTVGAPVLLKAKANALFIIKALEKELK